MLAAARPAGLLCGLLLLASEARAEIALNEVTVNEKPVDLTITANEEEPLRIHSTTRVLGFHFSEIQRKDQHPARLRYKLEGYDTGWRELHESEGAKVGIQFTDENDRIVGTRDFRLRGETPGWRGTLEDSDFLQNREEEIAPARTVAARIVVYGPARDTGMGLVAIDAVKVTVLHAGDDGETIYDLSITEGSDLDEPLGVPKLWDRQGSQAGMAILGIRPDPVPHPILVIDDKDPQNGGIWATDRKHRIPVQAGDTIVLEWQMAHSIGSAGPGFAEYRGLKPGRYRFRVAAAGANGELAGEEFSLPIDVVAPPYQRPEFWMVAVALMGGGVFWIKRLLAQRLIQRRLEEIEYERALEHERSRIARDLHDDIGSGLTEIAMQSDLIKRDIAGISSPDTQRRIENVCLSAIALTRSVDEIVWAVNPANDTLDHFANYLSQSTEEFLDNVGIGVRFDIPTDLPAVALPGKMRHELFLAVREALNNLAKHAGTEMVTLGIRFEDRVLHIVVEDYGCGFSPDEVGSSGTHEGLANMHNRLEGIGGKYHLSSRTGGGTRVEFILPLPQTNHAHATRN